ncbi:MAG: FAD-dependent thymidylate synthase [Endomicrobium sp.]|jgi:thymidylate synthase (FAD)|nr:FAD-dependent thymidylate synthase [Endomicrobium sp.]
MKIRLLRFTKNPEKICAIAARLCYSNIDVNKISKNLTKSEIKNLLNKVIISGHNSVLEHASFTFSIENVSRALLTQLTRHRIASFSVQSQRYVKFKTDTIFIVPKTIKNSVKLYKKYKNLLTDILKIYNQLLDAGIPVEDSRYVLPNASTVKIIITMNVRELRHFFLIRTCNKAQWEIRNMANRMLHLVTKKAPLLFFKSGPNCLENECHEMSSCDKSKNKKR